MAAALIVKTVLLLGLMTLRGVYSDDVPKCQKAECEKADVSSLLQSSVHASLAGPEVLDKEALPGEQESLEEQAVSSVAAALSQAQQDAVVLKHNELRASLGASDMMMLTWSQTLANTAQAHSASCPGSRHSATNAGENMAQKAGSNFQLTARTDLTGMVQSWFDEKSDSGSYQNGGRFTGFGPCTGMCGHYTQVAWQAANQIGCGVQQCTNQFGSGLKGVHFTCQYGTSLPNSYGGNMNNGRAVVFTQGAACSACPSGFQTCTASPAGLCSSGSATTEPQCTDKYSDCPQWAKRYCTCQRWKSWMATNCQKSCRGRLTDKNRQCPKWVKPHCTGGRWKSWMATNCEKSCFACQ